jgi:hypothetical protein
MANSNGWGDGSANNAIGWGQGANNAIGWGDVQADSWAGLTDVVGVQASTLLLDTYTGATVAYSLRKLRSDYSGSCIRVRRSSDNTEQNIGFVGNDLDTSTLLTFCGAGNGFITTWYDQSANANNSTQATAANQAQIVASGVVITDPNTSKVTSTWTSDRYTFGTSISPFTRYYSSTVFNRVATSNVIATIGNSANLGGANGQTPFLWLGAANNTMRSYTPSTVVHDTSALTGAFLVTSLKDGSNVKKMYRNGSILPTTATEAAADGSLLDVFGQAGGNYMIGRMSECIYWNSEQSANRTGIEENINTYWTIY